MAKASRNPLAKSLRSPHCAPRTLQPKRGKYAAYQRRPRTERDSRH